jgi:thiol-disulfide isomerase/thioredoxin
VISRISTKVALIIGILALLGIASGCEPASPSEAPDFTLPTLTGGNVTLSELQGTPVVLNFWSISCSFCRQQLPYLENVAQQTVGQIEVIAVNMVDSAESVQSFFGEYQPTMTVALDENAEVFVNYCQNFDNSRGYIPFTLFIDSEGLVQYKRIGAFASEEALWNAMHDVFGITIP